jgi:PAS domain S-box-containing protein
MTESTGKSDQVSWRMRAAAKALLGGRGEAPELKSIFEHAPVPMVIVDAGRLHVEVNRRARRAIGLSLDDLRALTIDDLTPSHLTRDMEQAWARLLDTGCIAERVQVTGRDGSRLDIVYWGLADVLPGRQLIAFAPAEWLEDELDATEDDRPDPRFSLTPREIEVLALAADGHGGPELAEELLLSPATINAHFKSIYKKLEVGNRAAAVAKAMRLGVID